MHRFYSPARNVNSGKIIIDEKSELHHLRDVLRLKNNDKILIFDDEGNEYNCLIGNISNDKAVLEIKSKQEPCGREKIALSVACAIPKKNKMDEIIDKLTQLGAVRIIPLLTERVIVRLDKRKELLRSARWQKIAMTSAKQSHRSKLPVIDSVKDIKEALLRTKDGFDLKLIPTLLDNNRKTLKKAFSDSNPKSVLVFIGPEGDFTQEEVDLAVSFGCTPVSLGKLVLRVETAAIAVASFIRLYEDG